MIAKNDMHQDIVLIVEDTPANHDVIRTFLTDIDICCESAFDGMEAVTKCSSVPCDHYSLILMDLNLPHMDGFKTAEALRDLGIVSPIVTITATDKNDPRFSRAGDVFNGVLFKPFNASEFFSTVMPYMQSARCRFSEVSSPSGVPSSARSAGYDEAHGASSDMPGFDIRKGIENLGNNRKLFAKHFNNFKTNNADLALRLTDMIRQGSIEQAAFLCHSIKGLSGMLGMTSLQHHMTELETMLKAETSSAAGKSPDAFHNTSVPDLITQHLAIISNDLRQICQIDIGHIL